MKTDIVSHFIALHFIVKRILLHFYTNFQKKLKGFFLTLNKKMDTRHCLHQQLDTQLYPLDFESDKY